MDIEDIEDTHPQFETYGALSNETENNLHHERVSVKYTDETQEEVHSIAIQGFVDETTPHARMGTQIDPAKISQLIEKLELIEADLYY
jgi:hypothetical protein